MKKHQYSKGFAIEAIVLGFALVGLGAFLSSKEKHLPTAPSTDILSTTLDPIDTIATSLTNAAYVAYSPENAKQALSGREVLFFYSRACTTCVELDADIKAHLFEIPSGTSIVRVSYEDNQDIVKAFGVTAPHTIIQLDSNGTALSSWNGGITLSYVLSQLK